MECTTQMCGYLSKGQIPNPHHSSPATLFDLSLYCLLISLRDCWDTPLPPSLSCHYRHHHVIVIVEKKKKGNQNKTKVSLFVRTT
jgi:hypothetical protein